ncbi:MAG: (2Fe-2S)-binding protein [Dehalobacterium sp.]
MESAIYTISLNVNGTVYELTVPAKKRLIDVLRDDLHLTGTREGCGAGDCGACNVILNDQLVNSCLVLAVEADGAEILTIEGLSADGKLHPIQEAFLEEGAVQCGFCTPGMIMAAKSIIDVNPHPTEEEIKMGISGNLCRCTGYTKIVNAVVKAAEKINKK